MSLAPIVVFAYNRPDHLRRTLEALAKNELAKDSVLYIYCDGAKDDATEEQRRLVEQNREVARATIGFKGLYVVERERNVGLKDNIVSAVTEIVNKYGRIITLEDDVITSVGYLRFMNEALELYKNEERVMHVSGYMWPHRWPLPKTFFYELPYPGGGWATWERAWRYYDDDATKLYFYWKDQWDKFNKLGADYLQKQLVANHEGRLNTWFIKWHAILLQQNGLTLYPGKSLTNNIGFDESATNCYKTSKFDVKIIRQVKVRRIPIQENWFAAHEIFAFYQGRWYNRRRRNAFFSKILKCLTICK